MPNKQTILIIDDNKEDVATLFQLLNMHNLISALSGQAAINIAHEEDIDLILLDVTIPNIDGFEVCKVLKSIPKIKHVPLIFLTCKNRREDIQKGFDMGAIDYIPKPFFPNNQTES